MERINPSSSATQTSTTCGQTSRQNRVLSHSRLMAHKSASFLLRIMLTIAISLSSIAVSKADVYKPSITKKAACRIEIDNPHISKSILLREGRTAVKVNARSVCNVYQTRVALTVNIYQVGLFRDYLRASFTTRPNQLASNGYIVHNKNTKWYCKSEKSSKFYGVAYSTAFIGGQQFLAPRVRSIKTIRLPCGI